MQPKPFIGMPTEQWIANWIGKNRDCRTDTEYADAELDALYHLLDEIRRDVQSLKNARTHDE